MTAIEQLKRQLDALPPEVREAEAERILDELKQRMEEHRLSEKTMTAAEAVDGLRRLSQRQTLGKGLTIRDLIEEGRRF